MEFAQILAAIDGGEYGTILQGLEMVGFDGVGLEIPIGYGFSITLYVGKDNMLELAHTGLERYALEKLYDRGGAIRVDLKWSEVANMIRGIIYFNYRLGLVLILEGLIELIPQPLVKATILGMNSLVMNNRNNRNVELLEMRNFVPWFDSIYYTGVIQSGKDPSFIGNILRMKRY